MRLNDVECNTLYRGKPVHVIHGLFKEFTGVLFIDSVVEQLAVISFFYMGIRMVRSRPMTSYEKTIITICFGLAFYRMSIWSPIITTVCKVPHDNPFFALH